MAQAGRSSRVKPNSPSAPASLWLCGKRKRPPSTATPIRVTEVLPNGVTIVIPTRDGRDLLATLLPGLRSRVGCLKSTVSDNGSADDTARWLAEQYPHIQVIETAKPLSFARAVNLGIAAARFSHTLLLNNDMIVRARFRRSFARCFRREVRDLFCCHRADLLPAPACAAKRPASKAVWRQEEPARLPRALRRAHPWRGPLLGALRQRRVFALRHREAARSRRRERDLRPRLRGGSRFRLSSLAARMADGSRGEREGWNTAIVPRQAASSPNSKSIPSLRSTTSDSSPTPSGPPISSGNSGTTLSAASSSRSRSMPLRDSPETRPDAGCSGCRSAILGDLRSSRSAPATLRCFPGKSKNRSQL